MKLLDRYILKNHIGPFIFGLATVVFLFLFQFLYKSLDQLIGKGLSIWIITKLISLNLAWMLTLAVPMAVLVSTLMAYGSLASNNEITIMKAGGISLVRLMMPVVLLSLILFYVMVRFNNDVLPEANHQARVLLSDISRTKPTLILEAGKFSDEIGGAKILVKKTYPNSNRLESIYIYDYSHPPFKNLFTAESGDIGFSNDFSNIIMNLNNGEIHQYNTTKPSQNYRKIKFDKHRIILDARGFGFQQSNESSMMRGDRELSAGAMNSITDSLEASKQKYREAQLAGLLTDISRLFSLTFTDTTFKRQVIPPAGTDSVLAVNPNAVYDSIFAIYKNIRNRSASFSSQSVIDAQIDKQIFSYDVEIYKKYSIPFACVVFALVGAPLGYRVRKGGFGIAAGLSLLFFLVYWASLIGGEKLADRGLLSPFLGMWLANIVLGLLGLYLMFKSS